MRDCVAWFLLAVVVPGLAYAGETTGVDLLVVDRDSDAIERFDAKGVPLGSFVTAGSGGLDFPRAAQFGFDGHLYVASRNTDSVLRYHGDTGVFLDEFVTPGSGGLEVPASLVFGPDNGLYVAGGRVYRYDGRTGAFLDIFVEEFAVVSSILFGPDGHLYIADEGKSRVKRHDGQTGAFLDIFVAQFSGGLIDPNGLAFRDGDLYVSGPTSGVLRYDGETGAFLDAFVPPAEAGIATSLVFGPDGNLYVTTTDNVRWFDGQTGAILGDFTPPGGISLPDDLLFFPTPFFADGFESGDTTAWSQP